MFPPYWFCIRFPCNDWIAILVTDPELFATGAAVCEVWANTFKGLSNNAIVKILT